MPWKPLKKAFRISLVLTVFPIFIHILFKSEEITLAYTDYYISNTKLIFGEN